MARKRCRSCRMFPGWTMQRRFWGGKGAQGSMEKTEEEELDEFDCTWPVLVPE